MIGGYSVAGLIGDPIGEYDSGAKIYSVYLISITSDTVISVSVGGGYPVTLTLSADGNSFTIGSSTFSIGA